MKINLIIEYILSCNSIILFIVTLKFVEFMVVLISFLCFGLMYHNHSTTAKIKNHFKQLPIFNRILAILFSIFYAIPNKIYINNNVSKYSTMFFILIIIIISNIFAPFILLYIMFWITVLESYFFAILYEDNVSFREFVNNKLFKGDKTFAKEYFSFFWGNMKSGGAGKGRAGLVGSALSGLYQVGRNHEKNHVRIQAQVEAQRYIDNAEQKPKTPEDCLAIQKKVEDHIIERDTFILKTEKQVNDVGQKVWNWWTDS